MEEQNLKIKNEELEIKNILGRYIYLYNLENPDEKIEPDNLFINNCVNKPGAIGCYNKNNNWYIYRVDDRFNLLVNGPFTKNAIIVALAKMMYIPSNIIEYGFSDEEYRLYLQGEKPTEVFEAKHL